jgi:DNA (cytosine-5)-methyltransferase 1
MFTLQGSKQHAVAFAQNSRSEVRYVGGDGEVTGSVASEPGAQQQTYIAFTCKDSGGDSGEVAPTLRAMPHDKSWANGGGQVAVAFQPRFARNGRGAPDEVAAALTSEAGRTGKGDSAQCVAFKPSHYTRDKDGAPSETMSPLSADADKGDQDPVVQVGAAVRRLTPKECLRLQGFPDDYLDITWRGKPAADSPKYRAVGNSMAAPVVRWILSRIEAMENIE